MTSLEISLSVLVVLLLIAVVFYMLRGRDSNLKRKLKQISSEYKRHLLIPDGLDGHIELDYLLLTSQGLVVLDHRDISGTIFPGAHLDLWTVLQDNQRFSTGLVVFPDKAQFGNEPPENVIRESDLCERFKEKDNANKEVLIKAFHQPYKYLTSMVG